MSEEQQVDKKLYCSFCGKNQSEVKKLIAGPSVYICDECVSLCNDIIKEDLAEANQESSDEKLPVPEEIKAILDDYVIGQESAKKTLAVAVYNLYKKLKSYILIRFNFICFEIPLLRLPKSILSSRDNCVWVIPGISVIKLYK